MISSLIVMPAQKQNLVNVFVHGVVKGNGQPSELLHFSTFLTHTSCNRFKILLVLPQSMEVKCVLFAHHTLFRSASSVKCLSQVEKFTLV